MDLVPKMLVQGIGAVEFTVAVAAAELCRVSRALQVTPEALDGTE